MKQLKNLKTLDYVLIALGAVALFKVSKARMSIVVDDKETPEKPIDTTPIMADDVKPVPPVIKTPGVDEVPKMDDWLTSPGFPTPPREIVVVDDLPKNTPSLGVKPITFNPNNPSEIPITTFGKQSAYVTDGDNVFLQNGSDVYPILKASSNLNPGKSPINTDCGCDG